MRMTARVVLMVTVTICVIGAAGCGKSEAEKKQEAAMKQMAEYKKEAGVDARPVSDSEARAQVEESRKEYEAQAKKGAPAGHMSMEDFKKMAKSREQ